MDLTPEFLRFQVVAEKNRLDRTPQLSKRLVGGMLEGVAGKSAQDSLSVRCAQASGGRIFDHLIILTRD